MPRYWIRAFLALVVLLITGVGLSLFAPYYSALIVAIVNNLSPDPAAVAIDGQSSAIIRAFPEGSGSHLTATINGRIFQMSYLVIVGIGLGAWLLRRSLPRLLLVGTLAACLVSHIIGVWLHTLDMNDPEQWVRTSRMVTFAWGLIPVIPLVSYLLLQRIAYDKLARNRSGSRSV